MGLALGLCERQRPGRGLGPGEGDEAVEVDEMAVSLAERHL